VIGLHLLLSSRQTPSERTYSYEPEYQMKTLLNKFSRTKDYL